MKYPFISNKPGPEASYPINLYLRTDSESGVPALVGTPGLARTAGSFASPVYEFCELAGYLYSVIGNRVYKITPNGFGYGESLGTVSINKAPVFMASNGIQVLIIDANGQGYIVEPDSDEIEPIELPCFASSLTFQDGYFIISEKDTFKFYISEPFDGRNWSGDYGTVEASPDPIVGCISDHNLVWFFKEKTTQIFTNTGNADMPFEWLRGAILQMGLQAPKSLALLDGSIFGLNERNEVFRTTGYTHTVISTQVLSGRFAAYAIEYKTSDAIGYAYYDRGAAWYVLTFPSVSIGERVGITWVYDASTQSWFQWSSGLNGSRHRSNCHAHFAGAHIVGDYINGSIYGVLTDSAIMANRFPDAWWRDNMQPIRRVRTAPPIVADGKMIFFRRFELYMRKGVGRKASVTSGPLGINDPDIVIVDSDATIILQWSDDNGVTWGNEHFASMGQIGEYGIRVIWRRLGRSRARVFRVIITAAVNVEIYYAYMDLEIGTS